MRTALHLTIFFYVIVCKIERMKDKYPQNVWSLHGKLLPLPTYYTFHDEEINYFSITDDDVSQCHGSHPLEEGRI